MRLLQGINSFLEIDVVGGKLGLRHNFSQSSGAGNSFSTGSRMRNTLSSAWPSCSLVYWKVRDAKGVIWAPKFLLITVSNESIDWARQLSKVAARTTITYESPLPRFLVKSIVKSVV